MNNVQTCQETIEDLRSDRSEVVRFSKPNNNNFPELLLYIL